MTAGKATAVAPANIAFIKYWGTRDEARTLPFNPSISMTLARCVSRCTVELRPAGTDLELLFAEGSAGLAPPPPEFGRGVERHLARLAEWAGYPGSFRVTARNDFPTGAGIASSASGFTALALAAAAALGREPGPAELSDLARRSGSGSAARSAWGGYVEWPAAGGDGDGAAQLATADHWDLRDLVAVVDAAPKGVSSREGHRRAPTSPYFERRLELLPARLERVRRAIAGRSLAELGPAVEEEAIDLHLIAMSSRPAIYYWRPGTLAVLAEARRLREREGVAVWATIDAGPNVHLICEPESEAAVAERIAALAEVVELLRDRVGSGPRILHGDGEHLI